MCFWSGARSKYLRRQVIYTRVLSVTPGYCFCMLLWTPFMRQVLDYFAEWKYHPTCTHSYCSFYYKYWCQRYLSWVMRVEFLLDCLLCTGFVHASFRLRPPLPQNSKIQIAFYMNGSITPRMSRLIPINLMVLSLHLLEWIHPR